MHPLNVAPSATYWFSANSHKHHSPSTLPVVANQRVIQMLFVSPGIMAIDVKLSETPFTLVAVAFVKRDCSAVVGAHLQRHGVAATPHGVRFYSRQQLARTPAAARMRRNRQRIQPGVARIAAVQNHRSRPRRALRAIDQHGCRCTGSMPLPLPAAEPIAGKTRFFQRHQRVKISAFGAADTASDKFLWHKSKRAVAGAFAQAAASVTIPLALPCQCVDTAHFAQGA